LIEKKVHVSEPRQAGEKISEERWSRKLQGHSPIMSRFGSVSSDYPSDLNAKE